MPGATGGRIRLSELNDQLTCKLCHGYFIDATTIVECLHSFCKSCIVKYLQTNKYCPICEVQVHECKPLLGIKPDYTLQDIVYKLVPGCYQNEMRCRREFYDKHPEATLAGMSPEARGEPIESHIYSADELLNLSLEYYNPTYIKGINIIPSLKEPNESEFHSEKSLLKMYLRCPAAVTVCHLQKLIRSKYELGDAYRIDFMYKEEPLCINYTLMDVMYIYHWRRKVPLNLNYRIFKPYPKRLALSDDDLSSTESEKIENENKKSNINKISKSSLTQNNYLSNESLNTEVANVPMTIDNSNQSELPPEVQNSVNTTVKNMPAYSGLNIEQNQIMMSVTTTTATTMTTTTTTTTPVNQQSSADSLMSTCSISNISKTVNPNDGDNNDKNNNDNSNVSNNSSNQSGNSSARPENLKANPDMNIPTVPSHPNTNANFLSKPTVRKMEILPKGMNLNKIYAKIGSSGSKINDICSKIINFSKRKSKIEKTKPGMPTLLKVTKKSVASTPDDVVKRISTIPNVPIYSPNRLIRPKMSEPGKELKPTTAAQSTPSNFKGSGFIISEKFLRTPEIPPFKPRMDSTSETLNSLVEKKVNTPIKNQPSKVQNNQMSSFNTSGANESINNSGRKPTIPKPPRLSKTRPLPKYLGNYELIIKPLPNNSNDTKEEKDQQSGAAAASKNTVTTTGLSSVTKIVPKSLSSIVPTNTNAFISSLPPYSPNRNYQNTAFSPVSSSSSLRTKNSPANMLSTNSFIPSTIPNTNLRSNFSYFPPSAFDTNLNRFSNLLIRSPLRVSTSNAFQMNILSLSGNTHQGAGNIPPTTAVTCPPGLTIRPVFSSLQRTSSSNYYPPSKSPKTTVTNSTFNVKNESTASTSLKSNVHLSKGISHDSNVFSHLTTTGIISNYASDLSTTSSLPSTAGEVLINLAKSFGSDGKVQDKSENKSESDDKKNKGRNNKEKEKDDEEKKPGDIGSKETGEMSKEKGNKGNEKQNDKEKQSEDDKNKEKREKLMEKKIEEADKKFNKCVIMMINDFNKNKGGSKNAGSKNAELPKNGAATMLNK